MKFRAKMGGGLWWEERVVPTRRPRQPYEEAGGPLSGAI